jgi:hypothetical protein
MLRDGWRNRRGGKGRWWGLGRREGGAEWRCAGEEAGGACGWIRDVHKRMMSSGWVGIAVGDDVGA